MAAGALTGSNTFWLIAGTMCGVAATLVLGTLWRSAASRTHAWRTRSMLVVSAIAIGGAASALYLQLGSPETISTPVAAASDHANAMSGRSATSMEAAIANLRARLDRGAGSDEDWELLAKSYEFAGDQTAADLARKHQLAETSQAKAVDANPQDATAWLAVAVATRREHKYTESRAAFEHVIELGGMSADSWADYADVLASLGGGKLSGPPAAAIEHALALDGNHAKALWLEASLAHEEHREADALGVWRKLRSVLPEGSSDVAIVDANIAEASELAGVHANRSSTAAVVGQVSISPELAKQAAPGSTLFIYAKSAESPGPPLAVFRSAVKAWPVSFRLDDSMAMMPSRTVSSAKTVIVEARISRTGQAAPSPGDFQATAITTDPRAGKPIRLTISKVIG